MIEFVFAFLTGVALGLAVAALFFLTRPSDRARSASGSDPGASGGDGPDSHWPVATLAEGVRSSWPEPSGLRAPADWQRSYVHQGVRPDGPAPLHRVVTGGELPEERGRAEPWQRDCDGDLTAHDAAWLAGEAESIAE